MRKRRPACPPWDQGDDALDLSAVMRSLAEDCVHAREHTEEWPTCADSGHQRRLRYRDAERPAAICAIPMRRHPPTQTQTRSVNLWTAAIHRRFALGRIRRLRPPHHPPRFPGGRPRPPSTPARRQPGVSVRPCDRRNLTPGHTLGPKPGTPKTASSPSPPAPISPATSPVQLAFTYDHQGRSIRNPLRNGPDSHSIP